MTQPAQKEEVHREHRDDVATSEEERGGKPEGEAAS